MCTLNVSAYASFNTKLYPCLYSPLDFNTQRSGYQDIRQLVIIDDLPDVSQTSDVLDQTSDVLDQTSDVHVLRQMSKYI
jgi:hypothetical protein